MTVERLIGSILDKHIAENARSTAAELKAIAEYNIMMGVLEDPSEEETEEVENG